MSWTYHPVKRVLDAASAAILLNFLLPLMIGLALLIRLRMGSPVFFCQARPGKDGKLFTLYKFRSMRTGEEPEADRVTPLGRFLRASSLDELPELWNILKGDMSFVGPRPLLPEYLSLYTPEQARRHECRPGLTGWAQIQGRNHLSWDQKFSQDVWYVDHATPLLDLKILILTPLRLASGGTEPAPPFTGSPSPPS
ncbi:MAG: sugar transferase [Verrucomicrobia bacterium]|nr:sugar transferase [Verrucomicrobiota bacterium]MCH8528108.1 sugar transferase [Kiritimatiellia bacterium]